MTTDRAVMQQAIDALAETPSRFGTCSSAIAALRQALAQPVNADEQAVFEDWLHRKCPSGDVTEVQRQWVASSEYADYLEQALAQPVPDVAAVMQERDELMFQRDLSRELMRDQALRIKELEQGQDALDAKRLNCLSQRGNLVIVSDDENNRWFVELLSGTDHDGEQIVTCFEGITLRLAIDAAMGTQPAPTTGKLEPVVPADSKMIAAPAVADASHRHHTQCTRYNNNCGAVHPSNCPECPFRKGAQP